ncbi:MAG: FCD domain-containing protein [Pseudomonadota bacterium]
MVIELQRQKQPTLQRLRAWLSDARIRSGGRLPPERQLSEVLGISRAELRKALTVLEAEGVVQRHIGRGTFLVAASGKTGIRLSDVMALAERTSPHEAMIARMVLEPELTGMAAVHATPLQLAELRALTLETRTAPSWPIYEQLDAAFHAAIAEAACNSLLAELHGVVNQVRVSVVWSRLDVPDGGPPPDYHSFAEHDAIVDALERRDRNGAVEAMRAHLKSIRATFLPET